MAHLGGDEVWLRDGWVDRFALDLPREAMGYGQRPDEVAKVVVSDVALLAGRYLCRQCLERAHKKIVEEIGA